MVNTIYLQWNQMVAIVCLDIPWVFSLVSSSLQRRGEGTNANALVCVGDIRGNPSKLSTLPLPLLALLCEVGRIEGTVSVYRSKDGREPGGGAGEIC